MDHLITWQKHKPSTMQGFAISIIHTFSSFDATEINALAEKLEQTIGTGMLIKNEAEGSKP